MPVHQEHKATLVLLELLANPARKEIKVQEVKRVTKALLVSRVQQADQAHRVKLE